MFVGYSIARFYGAFREIGKLLFQFYNSEKVVSGAKRIKMVEIPLYMNIMVMKKNDKVCYALL